MKKLPVFFHVPKCAGTYCIGLMWELLRVYSNAVYNQNLANTVCNIEIQIDNLTQLRALVKDSNLFCSNHPKFKKTKIVNDFYLDLENIHLLKNLDVFSIVIESEGFLKYEKLLDSFKNYDLIPFLFLRDPFGFNCSIHSYLTGNDSIHEPTHDRLKNISLEDYLVSDYVSESWLIRNLLEFENHELIKEEHFLKVIEILKSFQVFDYKTVETAVDKIFLNCYNLSINQINQNSYNRIQQRINKSNTDDLSLSNFKIETQNKFLEKTYWDKKLYNYFCKK